MNRQLAGPVLVAGMTMVFAGCSGGGSSSPDVSTSPPPPPPHTVTPAQIQAAIDTANNPDPSSSCGTIAQNADNPPIHNNVGFYWEIGDENGIIKDSASGLTAAGSVTPTGGVQYTRSSNLSIASASKWIYGAYVLETKATPSAGSYTIDSSYVPFLHFTSGYENMNDDTCDGIGVTVQDCLTAANNLNIAGAPDNGSQTVGDSGKFYYNSGHLEVFEGGGDSSIAGVMNGANLASGDLANKVQSALAAHNVNMNISYFSPSPAGGIYTTPGDYAAFLKGLIRSNDPLIMRHFLKPTNQDTYAVCTQPVFNSCPTAVFAPLPPTVAWHYSITHWIEDDPTTGDGAYSSPGKLGFYPWVDSTFTYYGIVAREDHNAPPLPQNAPFFLSDNCGEAIRTAFLTGVKQN